MNDVTRGQVAAATLILLALVAAIPLWGTGIVNTRGGGDSPFLLQRTHQMLANLRAGIFPVRWMPDAAYGLGYPFFSYYAALPYYLAGLLALAGADLLTAVKLVQTLGFVAAGLAMYGWMRGVTHGRWAAWLAAVAYTVAPFHLANVYVRGDSLSEFYAFIFYPLILWGLEGISDPQSQTPNRSGRRRARWLWPGLAYAGLLLTHNLSALIFTPFILLYVLFLVDRDRRRRRRALTLRLLALGFGLLLSAWVWLPTLAEKDIVQTGTLTEGYFHYTRHFRAANLVQHHLLFDYSIAPGGDTPTAMGLPQAVFAALGGLVLVVRGIRGRWQSRWGFVLLGLLLSTAMITPLSRPLWDHLPLLPMIQFPWRFLSVQALFAAAATAALASHQPADEVSSARTLPSASPFDVRHRSPFIRPWVSLPVATCLALSVLLPLRPERLPINPTDVTTERLRLYELFTGNIGTTIRHEYLSQAIVPRPFTSDALIEPDAPPRAIPLNGASVEGVLVDRKPTHQVWQVRGEGGGVAFPLLYWPGWRARVSGEPTETWPIEGSGYLALQVPPGEHTILLQLCHTPVRAVAEGISLCALVILTIVLVRAGRQISSLLVTPHWSSAIPLSLLILPLLALSLLPRETFDRESDLTMDFDLMPYLHHNPGGVDFGGEAQLAGYRLSTHELTPGDPLTITLDWSYVNDAYTVTVRLLSPAAVRYEVQPLAEGSCNLESANCNSVALRPPKDIPRGVYLLQLRLFGPEEELRARTARGKTQGALYLQPVRVRRGPSLARDTSVLAAFGPAIRLHGATVAQPAPDRLAVRLAWSAVRPVAANYGISLRLLDADGHRRVALDTQPGYGFLPTSLWRPGAIVTDRYLLVLPEDLPPDDGYHLEVVLYHVPTLQAVGRTRMGDFTLPLKAPFEARRPSRVFSLPPLRHPVGVDFSGEVRLAGYDLARGEDTLRLTLWWQALKTPQADYTVFIHLFDPSTEAIVAQSDAMPQEGAYPTSWWAAGEVVSDTVTLPLQGVPDGAYHLAMGLYDRTGTRLQATGPDGQPMPNDRVILPESVGKEP